MRQALVNLFSQVEDVLGRQHTRRCSRVEDRALLLRARELFVGACILEQALSREDIPDFKRMPDGAHEVYVELDRIAGEGKTRLQFLGRVAWATGTIDSVAKGHGAKKRAIKGARSLVRKVALGLQAEQERTVARI